MGIVDVFQKKFSYAVKSRGNLTKDGCKVSLKGAPHDRIVLNLDDRNLPFSGHDTRCDFLFIADKEGSSNLIVPIELKKGEFKAEKIVDQLQAGSRFAEEYLPDDETPELIAVAVTGRISKADRNRFKETQYFVKFLGKDREVRRIRCNEPLRNALAGFVD